MPDTSAAAVSTLLGWLATLKPASLNIDSREAGASWSARASDCWSPARSAASHLIGRCCLGWSRRSVLVGIAFVHLLPPPSGRRR